jgi:hypothetical protein
VDQIIHIFRKDIRRHWREIALSLATLGAFAWNEPSQWAPKQFDEYPGRLIFSQWFTPMVLIGWFLLIVRVVHEEVPASDRQFWVTRPYDWKKLLTAFSTLRCRSPLMRRSFMVSTIAGETTCPPREDQKEAPPGTIFSTVNGSSGSAPAELGISPVTVSSLDLRLWSRTQEDLRPRLCPGTPLTFSIPEEKMRMGSELNVDGLRLADY